MQQTLKRLKSVISPAILWWGFVTLGAILRLRVYLLNRSLWEDEASLAVNIVNRNFVELTRLLDYHQAAPIGFLFIEKLAIIIFGNHDYILRLFPLLAGILATYLLYKIARAHFGPFGLFAVLMFAISWWLVHYSSELKQYSSDIMVALLLVYLAGNCLKEDARARDFLLMGILGALMIWISHPSVFILAGIGLVLFLAKLTRKAYAPWVWILGLGAGWLASFGLEYLVSLRHIVADAYLIEYWRKNYVPWPPWGDKHWFVDTYYTFLFFAFHRADNLMALATLALSAIGVVSLLARNWKTALLVIFPFVMTGVVSALQRYPLQNRFMLFLAPFVLLLMAEGFRGIYWLVARWNPGVSWAFSGALALAVVWQIAPIVYEKALSNGITDIRPVIAYVAENRMPDDIVYVFQRTDPAFHYYAPLYGLDMDNVVVGVFNSRKKIALQNYEEDLGKLFGHDRVWFIFSEIVDCVECEGDGTQGFYLRYINNIGVLLDSFDGSGANAYLYDLSP